MSKQRDVDKHLEQEVQYYYDSNLTLGDLIGQTSFHSDLIRYLVDVLQWHFEEEVCAIYHRLNFYHTPHPYEYPLEPDVAIVKGVPWQGIRSYKVGWMGPAPQIAFEIASAETWKSDRKDKPAQYARMGVAEYFVYDPHEPLCWRDTPRRLFGWRLDPLSQMMQEMLPDEQGRLWSEQLDSWLVPDGPFLRLYGRPSHLRFTEAEDQAKRADAERRRAQIEARRAKAERKRAEAEAKRAEEERRRAEAEAEARQAETRRAEALAQKLRALGINPDEIS